MELQALSARARKNAARCMECGVQFTGVKPVQEEIEHVETEAESTLSGSSKSKSKKKKNDDLDWISQGPILPSAKTIAAKAQILEWLSEKPDCKIIIYTQFLPMIRIMGRVCETERWPYLKYSGAMSHTARDKALQDFASKPEVRVLLMSLKCGGLGLNIVAASRVILIDPWWNDAVEQQAFCRVFRIGQTDETRLARFCIKNSIDAAMFAVKERKVSNISCTVQSSDGLC
jgi:SNF2 family DNA or RNA helicase